jgi:hypothetical protein
MYLNSLLVFDGLVVTWFTQAGSVVEETSCHSLEREQTKSITGNSMGQVY